MLEQIASGEAGPAALHTYLAQHAGSRVDLLRDLWGATLVTSGAEIRFGNGPKHGVIVVEKGSGNGCLILVRRVVPPVCQPPPAPPAQARPAQARPEPPRYAPAIIAALGLLVVVALVLLTPRRPLVLSPLGAVPSSVSFASSVPDSTAVASESLGAAGGGFAATPALAARMPALAATASPARAAAGRLMGTAQVAAPSATARGLVGTAQVAAPGATAGGLVGTAQVAAPMPGGLTFNWIDPGRFLVARGWAYSLFDVSHVAFFPTELGDGRLQGRLVVVGLTVVNQTGAAQTLPPDMVVLYYGGKAWPFSPILSSDYGLLNLEDPLPATVAIPADGREHTVSLAFDVPAESAQLILLSPAALRSGWRVLRPSE